jgi:uncharacterized protein
LPRRADKAFASTCTVHLSTLNIHPVKSLRATSVSSAEIDTLGIVGDRRFLVVDVSGTLLTQRTFPQMATIDAALETNTLTLSAAGSGKVVVRRAPDPNAPLLHVSVWKSERLVAEDCGEAPAAWLSSILKTECRLVRAGPDFHRPVLKGAAVTGDVHGFADAYPFLVIGEASLDALNRKMEEKDGMALPMDRFRTNMVVSASAAFAEDSWKRIRVGEVVFKSAGPCSRCIMTTTDQVTGSRGVEPLKTLASFRRDAADPTQVNFGLNLVHESKSGVIRVGDPVVVLE